MRVVTSSIYSFRLSDEELESFEKKDNELLSTWEERWGSENLIPSMREAMERFVMRQEFEKAAQARDAIKFMKTYK